MATARTPARRAAENGAPAFDSFYPGGLSMHDYFRFGWLRRTAAKATVAMPVITLAVAVLATGCGTASPSHATGTPRVTGTPHTAAPLQATGVPRVTVQPHATGVARGTGPA